MILVHAQPVRERWDVGRSWDGRELPGHVLGELPVPPHHRHAGLPPAPRARARADVEARVRVQGWHVTSVTSVEMWPAWRTLRCVMWDRERGGHCVRNQFFVNLGVSGGDWATPHKLRQQASVFYWIVWRPSMLITGKNLKSAFILSLLCLILFP